MASIIASGNSIYDKTGIRVRGYYEQCPTKAVLNSIAAGPDLVLSGVSGYSNDQLIPLSKISKKSYTWSASSKLISGGVNSTSGTFEISIYTNDPGGWTAESPQTDSALGVEFTLTLTPSSGSSGSSTCRVRYKRSGSNNRYGFNVYFKTPSLGNKTVYCDLAM
jgi:hypothetical protein